MNLSPVFLMQFKNTVERILHVPGNYKGGILEMAVVLDHNVPRETAQERKDLMKLVQHLKLFQARAKLIVLVTDGINEEGSLETIKAAMQPFLDKKLMQVVVGEEMKIRYR